MIQTGGRGISRGNTETFNHGGAGMAATVCLRRLQTVGFATKCRPAAAAAAVLLRQRRAGGQAGGRADAGREAAGGLCSCDHGGGCGAHQAARAAAALSWERRSLSH